MDSSFHHHNIPPDVLHRLSIDVKRWALELGFDGIGITDTQLHAAEKHHYDWINKGYHGEMDYMAKHGTKRTRPEELVPNTLRVISVRLNYLTQDMQTATEIMGNQGKAYISRYALGRDYHKVMRNKLQNLCSKIQRELTDYNIGPFEYRAFTDSAPVLEVALAEKSGLGWHGKHTLLINKNEGSWFFLGEIYTNLPLHIDSPAENHCGTCSRCMEICPTNAIVAPYEVDARRCISYLTIELKGSIPLELRSLIGNRVYGCDDCQLYCPWNKFAQMSKDADFTMRHGLDDISLIECFSWSEDTFKANMAGSAIYRIGYIQWLRNIAVGLGNAPFSESAILALRKHENHPNAMLREHVLWAIDQQFRKKTKHPQKAHL